jgi:magnesium chelatase family protein
MTPREALEVSMEHSVAGTLTDGQLLLRRPNRDPHHSASVPAIVCGGTKSKTGDISLAHNGVLFLDELPEFSRGALEALRQPLETGSVVISRVNAHVTYPARIQLVAAMNPCRCGHLDDPAMACSKAPKCAQDYQNRLSGPLLDRIDLHIDVPAVPPYELAHLSSGEPSAVVAQRVAAALAIQQDRYLKLVPDGSVRRNADANGSVLDAVAVLDDAGKKLLMEAAQKLRLSARGYHRVLRVARTLADLSANEAIAPVHVAEALSYRRVVPGRHSLAAL